MEGRIALVTGASRGIGAAVAKRYAALGAHVILVARTVKYLESVDDDIRAEGKSATTLVPLDLRDVNAIDQLAVQIAERFGKLDILVGNAAMLGGLRPITHVTNKIWDDVIALNLTANWRLIRACDKLLKESDAGRAIFVTSGAAKNIHPYFGAYAVSKSGLETLAKTYAAEVEHAGICVNIVDPGRVRTDMRAEVMPGEDPETLPSPESVTDIFVKLASSDMKESGEIIK